LLEGIKTDKVADVVFEIVTGLAPKIWSRVHRLRTRPGGDLESDTCITTELGCCQP
jgi:hypothetical protein